MNALFLFSGKLNAYAITAIKMICDKYSRQLFIYETGRL